MKYQKLHQELKETIKQYKLPSFNDLDREFDISNIEHDGNVLRAIRRKMVEKIELFCKIIESLMFPDASSLSSIQESKILDDDTRQNMLNLFKKLMIYDRISLSLEIENDEKKNIKFIQDLFAEWKEFKPQLMVIVKNMTDAWSKDDESIEEKYFG